jgi:hypothetical protein
MSTCTGITASILINCDQPLVSGTKDTLYLINKEDIDSLLFDSIITTGINKAVSSINLFSGKNIYKIEGRNNSNEPSSTLKKGRYFDTYEHQVSFKIFSNSPAIKSDIESMVQRGNLIAIVENNYRGAGEVAAIELYGYGCGLEVTEGSRNVNDVDTGIDNAPPVLIVRLVAVFAASVVTVCVFKMVTISPEAGTQAQSHVCGDDVDDHGPVAFEIMLRGVAT